MPAGEKMFFVVWEGACCAVVVVAVGLARARIFYSLRFLWQIIGGGCLKLADDLSEHLKYVCPNLPDVCDRGLINKLIVKHRKIKRTFVYCISVIEDTGSVCIVLLFIGEN